MSPIRCLFLVFVLLFSTVSAHAQFTANVTNVTISGSPTAGGPVSVTVTITRSADLNSYGIATTCNPPLSDSDHLGCTGGGLAFPPGVNTATTTVYAEPSVSVETSSLWIAASIAQDSNGNTIGLSDPGITTPVTIRPVTWTGTISPSVVTSSSANPVFILTFKNANGTLLFPGPAFPAWTCSSTFFNWDATQPPNASAQITLPLLQPPYTQTCNMQIALITWDGSLTASANVTYQAPPNNVDLGPSCPRSGAENVCGSPINLTNGNTWTGADDYELPGLGGGISLARTWNSQWPNYTPWVQAGMFGDSWQSSYEKHLQLLSGGNQLLYWRGNGSAWFFSNNRNTWTLSTPADERATLTFSSKTGYTLTLRDGSVELYNTNGFLTALQDRNGNKATLTYDGSSFNRLIKVTDAAGRILQFNYASSLLPKQVTSIQDSTGVIANYTYDSGSHLTAVTYADNSVVNYNYDANGLMLSVQDQLGKILEAHTYDSARRGLSSQRAIGADSLTLTDLGTAVNGNTLLTDSKNNSTTYYAGQRIGNRWYMTTVGGTGCNSCVGRGLQTFSYDNLGNRISSTDPNGNQTNYSYDSNGNVTQISRTINSSTQASNFTWNSLGEILTATDPLGKITTNTYDTKGNLLTTKTPLGNTTTFTYDTKGELLTVKDPRLNLTTLTYTAAGLIASIKDAQNNLTQFQYDARGNRTAVIDALNQTTSFTYDSRNRLTKITYPTSPVTTTQFGYDYRGRRTSVTDANGKVTQYAYDDADRLTSVTDASNNVTGYAYDTENNLTSITDAAQNQTSFSYDAMGRVTQTVFPSQLPESYGYDANGNLTSKTDRNGKTINYGYDSASRLTSKIYPDSTSVAYVYDLANHLTQVTDPTGTYGFTFDADERLTNTSTSYSFLTGRTFTTGYGYDVAANRISFTDPEGGSTTYVYDTLNRLQTLTPPAAFTAGSFGFSYDALSRRTRLTRPNAVTTNYGYDTLSRLLSVLHQLSGNTIDGATYTVDNVGNRTAKTDNRTGVTTNYGYDAIYQLLSATQGGSATETYTYDPVGNRLSSAAGSYGYNNSNEMNSAPGATFAYDNNGNTTTKTDSTGTTQYAWDFENRLTSVTLPGTGGTVSFKYDPFGRRVYKSSSMGTSVYSYDGGNVVEEVDSSGAVVARYEGTQNIDEPLAMLRGGATSYYHADGLGSVISLSSSTGTLVQTYTFDSFGKQTGSSGSLTNPFQYTGREFDPETGLYYYRARYYDSASGRFAAEDPLGQAAGVNVYVYAKNSPTRYVDPSGLDTVVIISKDYGFGTHAAVRIDDTGDPLVGPELYDPGGAYNSGTRGSGATFTGSRADLQKYIDFQKSTGSDVFTVRFKTNWREEREIAKRIEELMDTGPGFCALGVSTALDGIGPFKDLGRFLRPAALLNRLQELKDAFFWEEQHRILVERMLPQAPYIY